MNERTAYYDRHSAVGAFLVAAGHQGAYHGTADRLCSERDSPDGVRACLGEAFSHLVDCSLWEPLNEAIVRILVAEETELTYGFLYELAGELTEQHLHFRCHAISRLYSQLRAHKSRRLSRRKKPRHALELVGV